MKKGILYLAILIISILTTQAIALERHGYLQGSVGQSKYGDYCGLQEIKTVFDRCDDEDIVWQFGGYMKLEPTLPFALRVLLSANYVDLGDIKADFESNALTTITETNVSGIDLTVGVEIPIIKNIDIVGKVGIYRLRSSWDFDIETNSVTSGDNDSATGSDLTFAAGGQYWLDEEFGINLMWQRYQNVLLGKVIDENNINDEKSVEDDIDTIMLGIFYKL